MLNVNNQIQNIGFQLKNLETQFESISLQIQNIGIYNISNQLQNMGIQMLNIGVQILYILTEIPNISAQNQNLSNKIKNLGYEIQNIGCKLDMSNQNPINAVFPLPNFGIPPNGIGMPNMNIFGNDLMNDLKFKESRNNDESKILKYNVYFENLSGIGRNIVIDSGTTINEMLIKFLKDIGKPEFIHKSNKIRFINNANFLSFDDHRKIDEVFFINNYQKVRFEIL